jgi:hypothetical protein
MIRNAFGEQSSSGFVLTTMGSLGMTAA